MADVATLRSWLGQHGFNIDTKATEDGCYQTMLSEEKGAIDNKEALDRLAATPKVFPALEFTVELP